MKWNFKEGDPLFVLWEDAIADSSGWISQDEIEDVDCVAAGFVNSIGFFHSIRNKRLYLFGMHQFNCRRISSLQSIPVGCIRKIRKLK